MASIKPLEKIAQKWSTVTPQRATEYTEGVQNPKSDWAQETSKGAVNYSKGIQAAIANKSFEKGVAKAGTDTWKRKTLEKGPSRWQQGVSISASDYQSGFAKYHNALNSLTLPARGPKGDPANINRVAIVAKTLHDIKIKG